MTGLLGFFQAIYIHNSVEKLKEMSQKARGWSQSLIDLV